MAKLSSVKYTNSGLNIGMLILRIAAGFMIFHFHGQMKVDMFHMMAQQFANPLHIGSFPSFILVLFAEIICAPLVVIGLFTRWATIPLIIELLVLIFLVHGGLKFHDVEVVMFYLSVFVAILLIGPGKISLDGLISRK